MATKEELEAKEKKLIEEIAEIDQKIKQTLLGRFIFGKIESYIEPKRKGTPKGDLIGLFSIKYRATLYMLQAVKQKELAKSLNVSHGMLRVWNTEKKFNETFRSHCYAFAEFFLNFLREKTDEDEKALQTFLKQPIEMISEKEPPAWFKVQDFSDYSFYHPFLRKVLTERLGRAADEAIKKDDLPFLVTLRRIFTLFHRFTLGEKKEPEDLIQGEKRVRELFRRELIERIKRTLLKPNPTERERKQAIFGLNVIAREYNSEEESQS